MKITDKIHQLKIDFTISINDQIKIPRFVNVVIIFDESITLIDTGVKGSEKYIFDYIRRQNRNIKEIETIILSHSHPDHIGSAAVIKETCGCKVFAHRNEIDWIQNINLQNEQRPVPGFFGLVNKSCAIDKLLKDQDLLKVGKNLTIKCLHTPGHSSGSISLLIKEESVLFTADTILLKNDIPNYDNYFQLLHSLKLIHPYYTKNIILTSWTKALYYKKERFKLLNEALEYLELIDKCVSEIYSKNQTNSLEDCKTIINQLGMPPFFCNKLVHNSFKSHIK